MRRDDEATAPHRTPSDAGTASAATPARRDAGRRERILSLALVAVLVLVALLAGLTRTTAQPLGTDAAADAFSAARAEAATEGLLDTPRVIGTDDHRTAHDELAAALSELGLTVTTHEAVGTTLLADRAMAGHVRTLFATRPGTDPTGTLVLATHYDTVVNAPGATDAGIGLAVILETVRALGPEALRNDLVVLLVDGEEFGMLGASAYVRDHGAELRQPVVVLNHEARGLSGRPLVTRTAGPSAELVRAMPAPETESLFDAMFAFIPNYTDFSVYRDDGGWWGLDMAVIGEPYGYHSPADDLDRRDSASLQHYGELTLALTRDLGDRDLAAMEAEAAAPGTTVLVTMPWGVQEVPVPLVQALAVLAVLALAPLAVSGRRARRITLPGVLAGMVLGLLALAGAVLGGRQLWSTVREQVEQALSASLGEPVVQGWFIAAEVVFALTTVALILGLGRLVLSARALALGAALTVMLALAIAAFPVPALVAWLLVPTALAALGAGIAALLPGAVAIAVRALALLPTGWMLGRMLPILHDFGISSATGLIAATIAIAALGVLPLMIGARPVDPDLRRRPRIAGLFGIILVPALVTGALTAAGIQANRTTDEPVQHSVTARVVDGTAHWELSPRTDWTAELNGTTAPTDIVGPDVTVERLAADRVRLTVTSRRGAQRLHVETIDGGPDPDSTVHLRPDGGALHDIVVDGAEVPDSAANTLRVVGLEPGAPWVIELSVAPGSTLLVEDRTDDPSTVPGWTTPPAGASLVQPLVRARTFVEV